MEKNVYYTNRKIVKVVNTIYYFQDECVYTFSLPLRKFVMK